MGYTRGPYAAHATLPALDRPVLYSSRKIDPQTGRYVLVEATGGFESMPSTAQRVYLLVVMAAPIQKFITPQAAEETRLRIVAALDIMTRGPSPAIRLKSVETGSDAAGTSFRRVNYRNLTTGLDESVQA